ncbi:hypothetical protein [Pseudomonas sp. P105]|uniref:hypothetical protein n=1 Tax=Pseudomonas sp. P105 TaxID=3049542 RepID=UPI0029352EEE|nr:hypothetical protein [Pseudomonas sp. P105]WNZ79434.1 hypothetical protein QOM08_04910 [Pseudomonas sp. P105]
MENLTLTSKELGLLVKILFWSTVAIFSSWLAIRFAFFEDLLSWQRLFSMVSSSFALTSGMFFIFCKWGWKFSILPEVIGRPVLEGVWIGELVSNYQVVPGESMPPVKMVFVIKQTYLTLSLQSFSAFQSGSSEVEAILSNPRTGSVRLTYIFELRSPYKGEVRLVKGVGDLNVISNELLKGGYWTNSPSNGELKMKKVSSTSKAFTSFSDVRREWSNDHDWSAS